MKKKLVHAMVPVMLISLSAATLYGCGKKDTVATETENNNSVDETSKTAASSSSDKDTLVIATANETGSVTTNLHNAVAGDYLNKMTHNSLFYTDENLEPQPDLVESYEILSDTEWLFHLKKGVKFHNGMEMTAEDVKASLDLCKTSPEVAQYGKSSGEVEVVDEYTVKLTTDGPQSGLLYDLCHHGNAILPKELIENGHNFNKEPIGTGPYKMIAWNKGESLEYEAFDDYFKGKAPIDHIIWKIIPEGSSRTMALEAGEADLIIEVENNDIERLESNDNINVCLQPGTTHTFMMVNNEKAPFDNIDFRKAVDSAIDKEAIVKVALNGAGNPVDCMLPNCFPGTTDENAPTYDVEKAKEYMKNSGLNAADCGFTLICSDDVKLRAGQVIQSCLKDNLNIEVALESMDLATYLDVTATGNYEAAIGGYTSDSLLGYASGVYHSKSINASNKTRTSIKEIDDYIDSLQSTVDPEENVKIITEFNKAINDVCPQIPLYMPNKVRAYNAAIQGFNLNASGNTNYALFSWGE